MGRWLAHCWFCGVCCAFLFFTSLPRFTTVLDPTLTFLIYALYTREVTSMLMPSSIASYTIALRWLFRSRNSAAFCFFFLVMRKSHQKGKCSGL
jgi:hypothetical protein